MRAVMMILAIATLAMPLVTATDADAPAGGILMGEGTGDGISVFYTSEDDPRITIWLTVLPAEDVLVSVSAGGTYIIEGQLAHPEAIGFGILTPYLEEAVYTVSITDTSGQGLSACDMRVCPYYSVMFSAGGGSGHMDEAVAPSGSQYVIPECGFDAPSGMAFSGWSVFGKTYQPGQSVPVNTDITVKAEWVEDSGDQSMPVIALAVAVVICLIAVVSIIIFRRGR